ncbi:CCN family member 5-like isoform X1 [Hyperolius riggenbachi]|uniref:CCN family member 5-like isoform X1 n=1 Tax=Hyperolius riggenbachi TaxID=752182 RepID=UPI0035A2A523
MLTAGLLLLLAALSQISARTCRSSCTCPWIPARCPPGVPLILDGCGCCKICARQLGESCDQIYLCDQSKELLCDDSTSSNGGTSGTCNYNYGNGCDIDGKVYSDGEIFQPNCRLRCQCVDGGVTCVPLCSEDVRLPSATCPFPRRMQVPGKCCPEWACDELPHRHQMNSLEAEGLARVNSLECPEWSTEWWACSALCGIGISMRVTNQNPYCRLETQSRLCMVRPCGEPTSAVGGSACFPTLIATQPIRWETQDCISIRTFLPTFCGSCGRKLCTPYQTVTQMVAFQCTSGLVMKMMMFILSCVC